MFAWMAVLTAWTLMLSVGVFDRAPASVAYADSAALDVRDLVVVRYETYSDGQLQEVLPPTSMPLWQYVQGGDAAVEDRLERFQRAFEADLHNRDDSFHLTHELIDGKEW